MNKTLRIIGIALLLLTLNRFPSIALGQGTAFTYQGQLYGNGNSLSGTFNFQFSLFTNSSGGIAAAGPVTNSAVAVTNGLFTVSVDFGPAVWNGQSNWLQIAVETNGASAFANLSPRQQVTPTPYAIFAEGANAAGLSGTIPASSVAGVYGSGVSFTNPGNSFIGNGSGLIGVNATTLGGLGAGAFWKTTGNAGTSPGVNFIGTTDNEPLDLFANGQPVLRLIPDSSTNDSPDIIGGSQSNAVTSALVGVTIGGGALNSVGPSSPIGSNPFGDMSSYPTIGASYAYVGGGLLNQVQSNATFSTVGGGALNTVQAGDIESTIAGGFANTISGPWSAIGGGTYETVGDQNGFIGGGWANSIAAGGGIYSVIDGGEHNLIQGEADHSVIAGGAFNSVTGSSLAVYATIGGGYDNIIQTNCSYCIIGGGYRNTVQTGSSYSVIAGGDGNSIANVFATVSGGIGNTASGVEATVAGGAGNSASYFYTTVSGGYEDSASGYAATVGGGYQNTANGYYSTLAGGLGNTNGSFANYSVIAGGLNNNTAANAEAIGGGQGNWIADYAGASAIAGGYSNDIGGNSTIEYQAAYSAIAGGTFNNVFGPCDFIGGGSNNIAQGGSSFGLIGGGYGNSVGAAYATVGGGYANISGGSQGYTTVGGGYENNASGTYGTIGGGANNNASANYTAVAGGFGNTASGTAAAVPGGVGNSASGTGSFAAGQDAKAANTGAFVWSDGSAATTTSTANNQFMARASGGFIFYTSSGTSAGAQLPAGSGSWSSLSDRSAKDHFSQVDAQSVLAEVASLPMTTWSYKTEPGVRHVGPMAQDFYAAFNVGEDNRHIAQVDEGGVALAAIQGLNQKLEANNSELKEENRSLTKRLDELEAMVKELEQKK